jgi:hypothetical protein
MTGGAKNLAWMRWRGSECNGYDQGLIAQKVCQMEIEEAKRWVGDLERKFAKDKIRFAVGKPGAGHSSVWSALGQKDNYYIGARSVLSKKKISLHGFNGKDYRVCRLALDKTHFELLSKRGVALPEDRVFVKWNLPRAPREGAAPAVILVFPTDHMTLDAPMSSEQKPVLIFNAARAGMAVEVGFFYSREPATSLEPKFLAIGTPIFRTDLDSGEAVSIVAREAPFDSTVIPPTDQLYVNGGYMLDPDFPVGIKKQNLTATLWNAPKDGEPLRIIEISGLSAIRNA